MNFDIEIYSGYYADRLVSVHYSTGRCRPVSRVVYIALIIHGVSSYLQVFMLSIDNNNIAVLYLYVCTCLMKKHLHVYFTPKSGKIAPH